MNCLLMNCAYGALTFLFIASPLEASTPPPPIAAEWAVPNLFGTVALPVTRTPYDLKWKMAWRGGRGPTTNPGHHPAATAAFSDLATVQRDINRRVSYQDDSPAPGTADNWAKAATTLARGSGDCEDFAIAKAQELLSRGFRPQDLYLVIGTRSPGSDHAILVVRSGGKFWVLDNLSKDIADASTIRNFEPMVTLSADRKWLHGYGPGARKRSAGSWPTAAGRVPATGLAAVKLAQSGI